MSTLNVDIRANPLLCSRREVGYGQDRPWKAYLISSCDDHALLSPSRSTCDVSRDTELPPASVPHRPQSSILPECDVSATTWMEWQGEATQATTGFPSLVSSLFLGPTPGTSQAQGDLDKGAVLMR